MAVDLWCSLVLSYSEVKVLGRGDCNSWDGVAGGRKGQWTHAEPWSRGYPKLRNRQKKKSKERQQSLGIVEDILSKGYFCCVCQKLVGTNFVFGERM